MSQEERARRREQREAEALARADREVVQRTMAEINFAMTRVTFDAARTGNPVHLEVSSDGGDTWATMPTQGLSIKNQRHSTLLAWEMTVIPPREDEPDFLATEMIGIESTNVIPAEQEIAPEQEPEA